MSSVMVYLKIDLSPNTNQAVSTLYNRTSARPSSLEHPVTCCCVCSAPNDLEQRRLAVAAPEKPLVASFQPVTNKDCRANNRRMAFRRVSSTNEYTAPQNTHAESLKTQNYSRRVVPRVLGSAPTQIFLAGEAAAGVEKIVTERRWDEQVVDLQLLGETSLVGRSKDRAPATRA